MSMVSHLVARTNQRLAMKISKQHLTLDLLMVLLIFKVT